MHGEAPEQLLASLEQLLQRVHQEGLPARTRQEIEIAPFDEAARMVRLVDVVAVPRSDFPEGGHAGRKHASRHPKRVGRHAGAVNEEAGGAVPFLSVAVRPASCGKLGAAVVRTQAVVERIGLQNGVLGVENSRFSVPEQRALKFDGMDAPCTSAFFRGALPGSAGARSAEGKPGRAPLQNLGTSSPVDGEGQPANLTSTAPASGGPVPRPLADPRGEFAPRRYRVRRARSVA